MKVTVQLDTEKSKGVPYVSNLEDGQVMFKHIRCKVLSCEFLKRFLIVITSFACVFYLLCTFLAKIA